MRVQSSLKGAKPRGKAKKMCEDLAVQKKSISFALVIEKDYFQPHGKVLHG